MDFALKNLESCVKGADGTVFDFVNPEISIIQDIAAVPIIKIHAHLTRKWLPEAQRSSGLFLDDLIPKPEEKSKFVNRFSVSRILKSGPYTHVFWADGTKTSVKRSTDEPDNDYAAFTAALAIKMYGSNSALKRMLRDKIEVQKPKKSTKGTSTGTDTSSAECTDTCPIDFDAIQRNLKKAAESATKQIIEFITGNAE